MSEGLADTPEPPYYAVIFTSRRREGAADGYDAAAARMAALASAQPGFLGMESAPGLTVCYWRDLAAIAAWKRHAEHEAAQTRGRDDWYAAYRLRIARVERAERFGG